MLLMPHPPLSLQHFVGHVLYLSLVFRRSTGAPRMDGNRSIFGSMGCWLGFGSLRPHSSLIPHNNSSNNNNRFTSCRAGYGIWACLRLSMRFWARLRLPASHSQTGYERVSIENGVEDGRSRLDAFLHRKRVFLNKQIRKIRYNSSKWNMYIHVRLQMLAKNKCTSISEWWVGFICENRTWNKYILVAWPHIEHIDGDEH